MCYLAAVLDKFQETELVFYYPIVLETTSVLLEFVTHDSKAFS